MATEADPAKEGGESSHPIPDNLLEDLAERVFHLVQQRQLPRQAGGGGQTQEGSGAQSCPESGDQTQSTMQSRATGQSQVVGINPPHKVSIRDRRALFRGTDKAC